ncbi:hypothetical protein [Thiolinea disciformis]|uniref:hypothetical protein n=1 Tax=Thiolinea disciformis TaxID=125614 RepID=UPI0012FE8662|nr:hypothetical protein [Thiolinea disciformis]
MISTFYTIPSYARTLQPTITIPTACQNPKQTKRKNFSYPLRREDQKDITQDGVKDYLFNETERSTKTTKTILCLSINKKYQRIPHYQ